MDSEHRANLKQDGSLGIFFIIAAVLLLWGYCWLKNYSALRIPQTINVIFHEVAGLNDNAAVYLDGVRVGLVERMEWQAPHNVLLRLQINKGKVEIPKGSKFDILTNGIVGAKYVEILLPPEVEIDQHLPPLTASDVVMGEDPVRPELAVNKLAIGLSAIDIDKLENNFEADRKRLVRAADQLAKLADRSMPIVTRTPELQEDVIAMSRSATRLTNNVNRLLDNPNFSGDLKETAAEARATVESLRQTMRELETTLGDKPLRADILAAMQQLREASENINKSVTTVHEVTSDKLLRSDIKDILKQAHADLEKVNEILSNPAHGGDVKATLQNARDALSDLDLVARQLHQVLNKREPLLRLMVGRPGYILDKNSPVDVAAAKAAKAKKKKGSSGDQLDNKPGSGLKWLLQPLHRVHNSRMSKNAPTNTSTNSSTNSSMNTSIKTQAAPNASSLPGVQTAPSTFKPAMPVDSSTGASPKAIQIDVTPQSNSPSLYSHPSQPSQPSAVNIELRP